MRVFSGEFSNWLRRTFVCGLFGHLESDWQFKYWDISHRAGSMIKVCERCDKELDKHG